jgi:hypothetical protein
MSTIFWDVTPYSLLTTSLFFVFFAFLLGLLTNREGIVSLPLSAILCKLAHEQEQRDTSALGKSKN